MTTGDKHEFDAVQRRRLRGFLVHLALWAAVAGTAMAVNMTTGPENPWFLLPMLGWAPLLAVHVAWVMGLLDGLFGRR